MAFTLEVSRYFCTANLDAPYVVTLMENGALLAQLAYYPSAETAVEAGLAWVRQHRPEAESRLAVVVAPDP